MGIRLIIEVLDHAPESLTPREWKALVVFAENARDETRACWPGVEDDERFTRRLGLSRTQRYAVINALIKKGALIRTRRGQKNSRAAFVIPVLSATIEELPGPDFGCHEGRDGDSQGPGFRGAEPVDNESQGPDSAFSGSRFDDLSVPETGTPSPQSPQDSSSLSGPERRIISAVGATEQEAREMISIIEKEHRPRSVPAYVGTMAANGDLAELLSRVRQAANRAQTRQAVTDLGDHPACAHGVPGGDQPHPDTGRPFCPICRNGTRTAPPRWEPAPEPPKLRVINPDDPPDTTTPPPHLVEPRDDVQAARDYLNRCGDGFEWVAAARKWLGAEASRDKVFLLAAQLAGQVA